MTGVEWNRRKARRQSTDAHKLLAEKEEEKRAARSGPGHLRSTTADSLARAIGADESQKGGSLDTVDSSTEDATRVLLLCTAAKVLCTLMCSLLC